MINNCDIRINDFVDVKDHHGIWRTGRIMDYDNQEESYRV
jgi:hypothetical protein